MRQHRASLPALGLIALALAVCLCGCQERATAHSIRLVVDETQGYYWENLIAGAQLAASDAGWKMEVARYDPAEGMATQLAAAREMGADYVAIAAARGSRRLPEDEPNDPKVMLIGRDTGDRADVCVTFDEYSIGKHLSYIIAQKIGLQKNFLLVSASERYGYDDRLEAGLRLQMGQHGSRVGLRVNCRDDADRACALVTEALESGERFDGILCVSENATLGALRAVRALGSDVPIIGEEFNDEIALGLRDGHIRFTVTHSIYGCAYLAVQQAIRDAEGRPADTRKDLDAVYVDVDNMFDEDLLPMLYDIDEPI